jgi:7,8-dihydroneopterin aldolase/epimerase/oxygenase
MENIIRIRRAVFYGYHGVLTEEQTVGGKFEADIDIYTDFSEAAANDDLTKTIDYEKVYKFVYQLALERKYYLIEALASNIADELLKKFSRIDKIGIKITKSNPPLGGVVESVQVEVIKSRDD